ncbi:MAG: SAP domain-containing protein [Deltaproteobacteria bacterium]|nr:MAG: SAP domain-containing protein [Deltaproteobacteria bacterium]
MNMQEIRERAAAVGLAGIGRLRKSELIQRIQQAEGNDPCFGAGWRHQCAEMHCCWREDCLKE